MPLAIVLAKGQIRSSHRILRNFALNRGNLAAHLTTFSQLSWNQKKRQENDADVVEVSCGRHFFRSTSKTFAMIRYYFFILKLRKRIIWTPEKQNSSKTIRSHPELTTSKNWNTLLLHCGALLNSFTHNSMSKKKTSYVLSAYSL